MDKFKYSTISEINFSLVVFFDHFIFSILLQHHISEFSKYFRSNVLSVEEEKEEITIQ